MVRKYQLATSTWDNNEIDAINRVVRSNEFTMGKEVNLFENLFSELFNRKYSLMVNSGSSANLLMIASLFYKTNNPLKPGDEVIVPSVSWSTTYMPLQQYNLKVKFVDIDLETLNYNLQELACSITSKTRIIIAVNLLGNPNDFNTIFEIIKDKDIIILEDNCESMGAKYNGQFAGSIGLIGTYSSFFSHHISTMEGGIITTDDEELFHIMLSLRAHGWTRNLPIINHITGVKSFIKFEESYKFVLPGYNVRPLEISAAIGVEQLKKLKNIIDKRRLNAIKFKQIADKYNWISTQKEIGDSSWFGFSIIVNDSIKQCREILINSFERFGIEYRPIVAGNFVKNPVIKYFNYEVFGNLINANIVDKNGLFIGNHHYDLTSEFELLDDSLNFVNKII